MAKSPGSCRGPITQGDSFCWGSWILKDVAPQSAAIESALMVYSYAVEHLRFQAAQLRYKKYLPTTVTVEW